MGPILTWYCSALKQATTAAIVESDSVHADQAAAQERSCRVQRFLADSCETRQPPQNWLTLRCSQGGLLLRCYMHSCHWTNKPSLLGHALQDSAQKAA